MFFAYGAPVYVVDVEKATVACVCVFPSSQLRLQNCIVQRTVNNSPLELILENDNKQKNQEDTFKTQSEIITIPNVCEYWAASHVDSHYTHIYIQQPCV